MRLGAHSCVVSAGEQAGQWCVLWLLTPGWVSRLGGPEAACEVWALGADTGQCGDVSSVVSITTSDIMTTEPLVTSHV